MRKILIILCAIFVGTAYACDTNQIDVNGDGTQCETAKFTITTKNLSADTTFVFYMSAKGTFYVDWGDGVVDTITRDNTTTTLYDHTYTNAGVKTIRFGGLATGFSTTTNAAAISFGNYYNQANFTTPELVSAIDGSLGRIFSTLGTASDKQPQFFAAFSRTKITTIPQTLFDGISGIRNYMFYNTFSFCSKLTSIPSDLFIGVYGNATGAFYGTFQNCSALEIIPSDLFDGITGGTGVFRETFASCLQLRQIPVDLFSDVFIALPNTFMSTFKDCTSLTGYIFPSMFSGLVANGSPSATDMWSNTFTGTNLATTCPSGKMPYHTGYENYWGGKVSCQDIVPITCPTGKYFSATDALCHDCLNDNYCVGGTYTYNGTNQGLTACPNGKYAPAGMWESAQCGRILHIGDQVVYLRSTKKTSPALHIDIDNDGVADFFGNMTLSDVVMNANTDKKLKLQYGGQTYSVYDDSVNIGE